MPLPDDLLNPINESSPSGSDLRYDPVYDKIKEARREEKVPPPGMTEKDRKVADNPLVIKLASEALTKGSKDLWLAAWLTEAFLKQRGFGGLRDGLALCHGLVEKFWDTLYPELEDGDSELRAAPLEFLGTRLDIPLRSVPLVEKEPYGFTDLEQAKKLGYETSAKTDDARTARAQAIQAGKVVIEAFEKGFEESSKAFYVKTEGDLNRCLETFAALKLSCEAKFGNAAPSWGTLEASLDEIRVVVHGFLEKKREKEPDPVEPSAAAATDETGPVAAGEAATPVRAGVLFALETSSEPADRVDAIRKVAEAAAFLRHREPRSPAPYLMLRGLRWGELRAAVDQSDPTRLEAPPMELRRHLKRLSIERKWEELLEAAENAMALPCSRAWLDLQRFVIEACEALGDDYAPIAKAVRSELKALVSDLPQLLDATLMDDTPMANADTRRWLKTLAAESPVPAESAETPGSAASMGNGWSAKWPGRPAPAYTSAQQALREGQQRRAFEILQTDIAQQRCGRERFRRKLLLVEMCLTAGKQEIAQPILDDLAAAIEMHKLDDWEDPAMVAGVLAMLRKSSKKVLADQGQQQKLFERICRLDPAQIVGDEK